MVTDSVPFTEEILDVHAGFLGDFVEKSRGDIVAGMVGDDRQTSVGVAKLAV